MLHYLKPYYGTAVLTICFMIAEVLVDLYQPRMMAAIVNEGILGIGHGGLPDPELVLWTGLAMVLIVLVGGFCGVMGGVCVNFCAQNFGNDIRKDCFRRILHFLMEQIDFFPYGVAHYAHHERYDAGADDGQCGVARCRAQSDLPDGRHCGTFVA